jgi:predicted nuclease with TOPRIM domain
MGDEAERQRELDEERADEQRSPVRTQSEYIWETFDSLFKTVHRQARRLEELEARTSQLEGNFNTLSGQVLAITAQMRELCDMTLELARRANLALETMGISVIETPPVEEGGYCVYAEFKGGGVPMMTYTGIRASAESLYENLTPSWRLRRLTQNGRVLKEEVKDGPSTGGDATQS